MQRMARIGAVPAASVKVWLSEGAAAAIDGTMPSRAQIRKGADAGVPAMRMIDTSQTIDPIGRAWGAGLLDGVDGYSADDLRDAGRRFAALYWRKLPNASAVSSLYVNMVSGLRDELPAGVDRDQVLEDADARDERQEAMLMRLLNALDRMDRQSRGVRKATDQLTLDPFADAGPAWLDWLIAARSAVLPTVIGAIGRSGTVRSAMDNRGVDPDRRTCAMMYANRSVVDRPLTPIDWPMFVHHQQVLRLTDCLRMLHRAHDGLALLARGGRAIV